jgi:hypothetical protein
MDEHPKPKGLVIGALATDSQSFEILRRCFVDCLPRVAPQILEELVNLAPLLCKAVEASNWIFWGAYDWLPDYSGNLYDSAINYDRRLEHAFATQFFTWAKKYHITSDWFLEWAFSVCYSCMNDDPHNTSGVPPSVYLVRLHEIPDEISPPSIPTYSPLWDTKKRYLDRVSAILETYILDTEKHYRKLRASRSPGLVNQRHATWLIQYQCLGMRWAEIARAEHPTKIYRKRNDNTVSDAAKELAKKLGLSLRESPSGR